MNISSPRPFWIHRSCSTLCRSIFLMLVFGLMLPTLALCADGKKSESIYVQVRASKIRSEPKPWATGVESVNYGAALSVIQAGEGAAAGWIKVKGPAGQSGFIPVSAVTSKKVVLKASAGKGSTNADSSDVVLAGKGFSAAVEKEFAAANSALNFKAVNSMEKLRVGDAELVGFIKSGKLKL